MYQKKLLFKNVLTVVGISILTVTLKADGNMVKYNKLIKADKNYKYNQSFNARDYSNVPKHVLKHGVRKILPGFRIPDKITKTDYDKLCKKYKGLKKDDWNLAFHDEFDGSSLDKKKWFTDFLKRDFEYSKPPYLMYYYGRNREYKNKHIVTAFDEKQLVFKNGILQIITEYKNKPVFYADENRNLVSSMLTTRMGGYSQRYGYFEIRCKMNHHPNMWPAFWLWPEGGKYKGAPGSEVDIMENWGYRDPSLCQTVHWATGKDAKNIKKKAKGQYGDYHTYAAELTPEEIILFIDGKETFRVKNNDAIAHDFLNIYLENRIDGRKTAPDLKTTQSKLPNIFEIDYVRAYQRSKAYYEKKYSLTNAFWDGRPHLMPGTLEAEWYDKAGKGKSFNDSDNINDGDIFRYDGVDIKKTADVQYCVYNTKPGEWLKYTVYFTEKGKYKIAALVSSKKSNAKINLTINNNKLGTFTIPKTKIQKIDLYQFNIEKGKAEIRIDFLDGDINIDKFIIRPYSKR